jgi:tRNA/tmRNA/rRNA uracil-C5-methylase (TrmA/RlmC/RlmD family)
VTTVELRTTAMAVGGEAVARDGDGRVVFVAGALPDELLRVAIDDERSTFARGHAVDVIEASPDRIEPPCAHQRAGCGGCDWQHIEVGRQRQLRLDLVAEVLERSARIATPLVEAGPVLAAEGLRTTVRGVADADGRFAFRRRRSHDPIAVDSCLVAHPLVEEIIAGSRFAPGSSIVIRVGARTGDRQVVVTPTRAGAVVPEGVELLGDDQKRGGRRSWIHEEVAGRRLRVSAGSFLQASPEGAEALLEVAGRYVDEHAPDARRLVDLCCGVGLFGGALGEGRSVLGVERSASAVADARHNLADRDARIVKVAMERWRPSPADLVIADPARAGLGASVIGSVAATGAGLCVLVSCDPAALGRDAALLAAHGYEHVGSTVVDLFGHSSHIEVVSGFRSAPERGSGPA